MSGSAGYKLSESILHMLLNAEFYMELKLTRNLCMNHPFHAYNAGCSIVMAAEPLKTLNNATWNIENRKSLCQTMYLVF